MSLYHDLYRNIFMANYLPQRYGGIGRRWRELEQQERRSLAQNQEAQWQTLQSVLQHAYTTTRFYRQRFEEAGLTPAAIRSPLDLRQLPVLTRDDIRSRQEDLCSSAFERAAMIESATGGTTDTPVTLLRSPECMRQRTAVQLRFNAWAGAYAGDKFFWLWGAQGDFAGEPSLRWRLWDRYVLRRTSAQTSRLNAETFEEYRQQWNRFRPKIVMAYPTPLALFCDYLSQSGKSFHRPQAAMVTAEVLLPEQREIIRNTLGIDPFVQYGTRDFGMIAAECERHEGLHVCPSSAFIELVPVEEGGGAMYEMVITDLTNLAMPMVRYRINDCALPAEGACACGRGYPLIREIVGRTTDNFYLPDGTVVSGVVLPGRILKVCPGIRKMQIIQETYTTFRIRYIPGPGFVMADLKGVAAKLQQYVGEVEVEFDAVTEIPREPSGKTRFFISRVQRAPTTAGRSAS